MDVQIVQSSTLEKYGRMDPRFMLYAERYLPLVEELVARFTLDQLRTLALRLPYDSEAAVLVFRGASISEKLGGRSKVFERAVKLTKTPGDMALYVARASQWAVSKFLEVMEEAAKEQLARVEGLRDFIRAIDSQGGPLLRAAIREGAVQKVAEFKALQEKADPGQ